MKKIRRAEILILFLLAALILLPQLIGSKEVISEGGGSHIVGDSISVLAEPGTTVACLTGTTVPDDLLKIYSGIEIQYYNTNADLLEAVVTGKADYAAYFDDSLTQMIESYPTLGYISEPISTEEQSFAVSKKAGSPELLQEFNTFLREKRESGEYDLLLDAWEDAEDGNYTPSEFSYSGEKGILSICTSGSWEPMSFYYNNELTGFFVELLSLFCSECGYTPEFHVADFAAELTGLASGTYVFMADVICATPEREESAYMTDRMYSTVNIAICQMPEVGTETVSRASVFFSDLKTSLIRNFITEDRWKLLLSGLYTTVKLSFISAFFGLLLGALICFCRMSRNSYLNAFARLYIKFLQGIPTLVLLMILYYVVLSRLGISAYLVCVIGFSMDFSAYGAEIFRAGIEAVPSSQMRAAEALGFSRPRAFIRVILPQAVIHMIPVLTGQFIAHIKMTSVAGYISVQDLTKVSDIIRSRTYEAFFPLLSTALVYFLISSVLILLLRKIEKKVTPSDMNRKIRGVDPNAAEC